MFIIIKPKHIYVYTFNDNKIRQTKRFNKCTFLFHDSKHSRFDDKSGTLKKQNFEIELTLF